MHTLSLPVMSPPTPAGNAPKDATVDPSLAKDGSNAPSRVKRVSRRRKNRTRQIDEIDLSLRALWSRYRRQLRRCQRKLSTETVHDLRVQTRRLLVCLDLFGTLTKGSDELASARRILSKRLTALGPLRDAHVQLIDLDERLADFPEVIPLHFHLHRRANRLARSVGKKLGKMGTTKLGRRLSALRRQILAELHGNGAARRLREAYGKSLGEGLAILAAARTDHFCHEVGVHEARICLKHLRYGAEALPASVRAVTPTRLNRIKKTTAALGRIHDIDVHLVRIAKLESKGRLLSDSLAAYRKELARCRRRLVTEAMRLSRSHAAPIAVEVNESPVDKVAATV